MSSLAYLGTMALNAVILVALWYLYRRRENWLTNAGKM